MRVVLSPGERLEVSFEDNDGEIIVAFNPRGIVVKTDWPDSSGREGVLYAEVWKGEETPDYNPPPNPDWVSNQVQSRIKHFADGMVLEMSQAKASCGGFDTTIWNTEGQAESEYFRNTFAEAMELFDGIIAHAAP